MTRMLMLCSLCILLPIAALALSTAFTYQGRLTHAGVAPTGLYDLRFTLYDAATDGTPVGTPVTLTGVPVTKGLFTVALDFGAASFLGADRWLEIAVRSPELGNYLPVSPRQPLTPAPYALFARGVWWENILGRPDTFGTYQAGSGLTLTGNIFSISNGAITDSMIADVAWDKITGPPIDFTALPPVISIEQLTHNTYHDYLPEVWQSFTAPADGPLKLVDVMINASANASATLTIYAGTGTEGAILGSQAVTLVAGYGWQRCVLTTPVTLTKGQVYTFAFSGVANVRFRLRSYEDPYPGGRDFEESYHDLAFRLYSSDPVTRLTALVVDRNTLNVGLGTTTPGFPLNFANALGDKIALHGNSGNHYGFGVQNNLLQVHTENNMGDVAFGYGSSTAFTETMRIKGNGNVGIGTSNPGHPLTFPGILGDKISLYGQTGAHHGIGVGWGTLQIHTDFNTSSIVFGYGSSANLTETMRITGSGNVGIGTSTPGVKLDVAGTARMTGFQLGSTATAGQVLTTDAAGIGTWQALPALSGTAGGDLTGTYPNPTVGAGKIDSAKLANSAVTTVKVADSAITNMKLAADAASLTKVTGGGMTMNGVNVGIGTSTAGFPLNFANVLGDKIALYGNSGNHYGFGVQNNLLQIHSYDSTTDIGFGYGSSAAFTETMRVTGSGNVGIGTSTPGVKLDVAGTAKMTGFQLGTTATAGQVLTTNAAGVGTWQALPPPSGAAGGDLAGTYPNPTIGDGKIVTSKLANSAVTDAKIADTAVNTAKLANGAVTDAKIADTAVSTAKLATGAVTNVKIADGAVSAAKLADGAVTDAKIAGLAYGKITGVPTSLPPNGAAGGDLAGTYPNPSVGAGKIDNTKLAVDAASLAKTSGGIMTASSAGVSIGPDAPLGAPFQVYGYGYTPAGIEQMATNLSYYGGQDPWQSFTPTADITLKAIEVLLNPNSADPDAQLTIYTGDGTEGTVVASQAITIEPGYGYHLFTFSTPVALTAGVQYTFAFSGVDPWMRVWYRSGNPYAGGRPGYNENYDMCFRLISAVAETRSPALVVDRGTLNVGVGTNTPGFPLTFANEVGDKIALWGQSGAHYGFGVQSNLLQMHTNSSGADIAFGYGSSTAFTEAMRIKGTGNVGIGTSAPGAKLEVAGTAKMTGLDVSGTAYLAGNVGIGTSTPGAKLDVAGLASVNGLNVKGASVLSTPLEVGGRRWILDQQQTGGDYVLSTTNGQWQSFTAGASGSLVGVAVYYGATDKESPWKATLSIYAGEGTTGALLSTQTVTGDGSWSIRFFALETDVAVTAGSKYTLYLDPDIRCVWVHNDLNAYSGGRNSSSPTDDFWFQTYIVNAGTWQTAMLVQPGTGNVGIGTSAPGYTLHVKGTLAASNLPSGNYRNVQWNPDTGQFFQDNSSRRYKEHITPLVDDFGKLLLAKPKTYTRPGAPDRWEIGYIAEEIDALGLKPLVQYDTDGLPAALNYDKMVLYLTEIAKDQQQKIEQQQTQIDQQQARSDQQQAQIEQLKANNAALAARLAQLEALLTAQP